MAYVMSPLVSGSSFGFNPTEYNYADLFGDDAYGDFTTGHNEVPDRSGFDPSNPEDWREIGYSIVDAGKGTRDAVLGSDTNNANTVSQKSALAQFNDTIDQLLGGVNTSAETANLISQQNTKTAQEFALEQMHTSAELERYLRSTAYQDTVKSLKEAGLNPMLAYMNGPISASAPTASVSAAQTFKQESNKADEILAVAKLISNLFGSIIDAFKL